MGPTWLGLGLGLGLGVGVGVGLGVGLGLGLGVGVGVNARDRVTKSPGDHPSPLLLSTYLLTFYREIVHLPYY